MDVTYSSHSVKEVCTNYALLGVYIYIQYVLMDVTYSSYSVRKVCTNYALLGG